MDKETVTVECANGACKRPILFVKSEGIPKKTFCDFCCNGMSSIPDDTPIDKRITTPMSRGVI